MSVDTRLQSSVKPMSEPRAILGPGGNRVRVSEESKRKKEDLKKPPQPKIPVPEISSQGVRKNVSTESLCSSDSSSSGSSVKKVVNSSRRVKQSGVRRSVKVVPDGVGCVDNMSPAHPVPVKRCEWITPNSDQLYTSLHDDEWGVPVHDDKKLFELLVLSQALGELSWLEILNKRDIFRKLFDHFDPSSIAKFTDKKLVSLKVLLSEPKLCAVVGNAKQILKIQQEFGSFSNYCWSFVNHKPIRNGFRYGRHVPVKTPKAEVISKDLMQRGFRCVGPTVVYSFMQVAGIVNDHLITCFRYHECNNKNATKDQGPKIDDTDVLLSQSEALENSCLSHDSIS